MSNIIQYLTTDNLWPFISAALFVGIYLFFVMVENMHKKAEKNLKPAFFSQSPVKFKYALKPIRIAKEYKEVPIGELVKICGLQGWTDGLLIPANYRKKWYTENDKTNLDKEKNPKVEADLSTEQKEELLKEQLERKRVLDGIEERLQNPLDSLIVCEINEQVGKGIFLNPDAKPIPPNTVLGLYAGVFKKCEGQLDFTYALSLSGVIPESEGNIAPIIDAKDFGNIFRLLQDLPSEEELGKVKDLPKNRLENMAIENVQTAGIFYKEFPVMYFKTIRTIEPGDQLGFSYRGGYWNNWVDKRKLFDKDGNMIGHFLTEDTLEFYSNLQTDSQSESHASESHQFESHESKSHQSESQLK